MSLVSILVGAMAAALGGAPLQYIAIDRIAWPYVSKKAGLPERPRSVLTLPLGMLERALYVLALVSGNASWIGLWLGLKTAASWNRWQDKNSASTNVWLLGNGLSVLYGAIGAWYALGCPLIR